MANTNNPLNRPKPNAGGPWQRPPRGRDFALRLALWFGLLLILGFGLWELAAAFPGQMSSDWDKVRFVSLLGFLALLSRGVIFARAVRPAEIVRNIAIWGGLAVVLILGYAFRDELNGVWLRVRSELVPGYAVQQSPGSMTLTESEDGQFIVVAQVNGVNVRFVIDTGASDIVLSPADAMRAGIDSNGLDFSRNYETANGLGKGARVILRSLAVGPVTLANVPASVNQAEMNESLLGLAFLRRLASVEISGRRLTLRWN